MADPVYIRRRVDPVTDQKARLAVGLAFDAVAPTNFLPTNPAALKRAFETGGASVAAGSRNFLDDLVQLLVGPLFVCAEIAFAFGARGELRERIEAHVGPTVARRTPWPAASA